MTTISPSSAIQNDSVTGALTEQLSTGGSAHVLVGGAGINVAASVDVNAAVAADVDAAVAAVANLRLVGFACKESAVTPAAASFNIVHGATGAGGTVVVPVKLAASESKSQWFGDSGISVANGLSIDWIAGTSDIVLFHKTVNGAS